MGQHDPRSVYDDLISTETEETLSPATFAEHATSEAVSVGWVVVGFVFDAEGRILLVREPWADGWKPPAGTAKSTESLAETLVRELSEETGIDVDPIRPHAVEEYTMVHEDTGETAGFTTVSFEARAETTAIADELGGADEQIDDAAWFAGLPENVYHPLTARVYRRCERAPTP